MSKERITPSKGAAGIGTRAVNKPSAPTSPPAEKKAEPPAAPVPESPKVEAAKSAPSGTDSKFITFGVDRVDDLTGGGLRHGNAALLYGPPYLGREHMGRLTTIGALNAGIPVIYVHTDDTADDLRERLIQMDPTCAAAQKTLLHHVDCFTHAIDAEESKVPTAVFVDGPLDFNGISTAINSIQSKLQGKHKNHLLVFDNLSTMIAYSDVQIVFRFLQILLGRTRRSGGSALVQMAKGMHAENDVQTFRHLTNGSLEFRDHDGKFQMQVQGISAQDGLGWVDYRFHGGKFELTGSFARGRIR